MSLFGALLPLLYISISSGILSLIFGHRQSLCILCGLLLKSLGFNKVIVHPKKLGNHPELTVYEAIN
jgi:hypothetical protein